MKDAARVQWEEVVCMRPHPVGHRDGAGVRRARSAVGRAGRRPRGTGRPPVLPAQPTNLLLFFRAQAVGERLPASRSACATQFRIASADGSNSRASSPDVRPDRTSSTICCRNAAGYGGLDFGIVDSSSSSPRIGVRGTGPTPDAPCPIRRVVPRGGAGAGDAAEQFGVVSRWVVVVAVVLACGFTVGAPPHGPAFGAAALMAAQDAAAVEAALGLDRPTRRLIQQGLGNEGFDPGTPDGLFGPRTRDAIRRWQAARGLPATGHVDSEQVELLRAAGAPRAPEPERVEPTAVPVEQRVVPPASAPESAAALDAAESYTPAPAGTASGVSQE